jgi:pimeloyl-ACP methyl ester carboxylesterase
MKTTIRMATLGLILALALVAAAQAAQVTDLKAVHREGQTFLTWTEPDSPVKEDTLSHKKLREMMSTQEMREKGWSVRYRVYRSDKPITSLEGLKPVGGTGELSCWNGAYFGTDPKDTERVPRYIITEGQPPLAPGTGLYVHNPAAPEQAKGKPGATFPGYYAVTMVTDGQEDATLGEGNSIATPVLEKEGSGVPVLQSTTVPKEGDWLYKAFIIEGPTLKHYIRWESPPNANRENMPIDFVVGIPRDLAKPAPVGLHLHCWGGSPWGGYGWWFNADKGSILIATHQEPYDWWTGYHELRGKGPRSKEAWQKGVVRPYTQNRLLSLLDWAATQWEIDRSRVFTGGISMGGSGAPMLAIRHPDKIAWAIGWVGVHNPAGTPTFKGSYAAVYGEPEWGIKFEDGTPVWDYFNDIWYLRQYPARETPFITWANGKDDYQIGWPQAVEFYKAMQETKRPHLFVWGQAGHSQRAMMPGNHDERQYHLSQQRIMTIDIRIDQSLPAFTRCSLDGNPGNGDPNDGDKEGAVNFYLYWETKDIVDEAAAWEMTVGLTGKAPKDACTVDLTPRRLQTFKVKPGEKVKWSNESGGAKMQSGEVTVDGNGLMTIEGLKVLKAKNRVKIAKM